MVSKVGNKSFTFCGVRFPARNWPIVNVGGIDLNLKTGEIKIADPTERRFGSPTGVNQESGMEEGYSAEDWISMKRERNL